MRVQNGLLTACLLGGILVAAHEGEAQTAGGAASTDVRVHPDFLGTVFWGSGIIDVPVAWTSPVSGDLTVHGSVHGMENLGGGTDPARNGTFGAFVDLFGKGEAGVVALSDDDVSLFARAQVFPDDDLSRIPPLAIGARGISLTGNDYDRFGHACDCAMPVSFYGVASDRSWVGRASLGWSVGWGTGLFRRTPGRIAADVYNDGLDTKGFFGGVRLALPLEGPAEVVHAMADWNGWDLNAGMAVDGFGLQLGVFLTEIENLGSDPAPGGRYNVPRLSINLSTRTNVLHRGSGLRGEDTRQLMARVAILEERLDTREAEVRRLRGLLSQGAMPAEALAELRELRAVLRERIEEQEREIERLEAQLSALRAGRGASGGG